MKIIGFAALVSIASLLNAQIEQPFVLGVGIGTGWIIGEIDHVKFQPAMHVFAQKFMTSRLYAEASFGFVKYAGYSPLESPVYNSGMEKYYRKSNFNLSGSYNQTTVCFGWNIVPAKYKEFLQICAYTGIGVANFSSRASYRDLQDSFSTQYGMVPNPNYQATVEETYYGRHAVIPIGLTVNCVVTKKYRLGLKFQRLAVRSDDVDLLNSRISDNQFWDRPYTLTLQFGYAF